VGNGSQTIRPAAYVDEKNVVFFTMWYNKWHDKQF